MVTSGLDTVLSPFFRTDNKVFCDFWNNASYLLAESFFQLVDSFGISFIYFLSLSNPRDKGSGVQGPVIELAIQYSKPKSQFYPKSIV